MRLEPRYLAVREGIRSGLCVPLVADGATIDGPAGIAIGASTVPALVLLDIQLPGMDGYEVARRLRAAPALESVPIVAVASYAVPGDHGRCLEAGCTGYLEMPSDALHFAAQVEQFMETRS